ncbi:MAG TPA: nucleoside monophosphate kinase [Candidatus Levybacteria bacterium]|nr:nucleoside monophosphate kinase [Candidatus Levybacteria bacterium]
MKIVLIGIQGSGKSTQGNLLSKKLKVPYLSTGHILRDISKEKTRLGRYIKETINAGVLVPDSKIIPIVEEYLQRKEYANGYILDGFPRTLAQAKVFNGSVEAVIYLNVSDKEALWRLSYREEDDADDREDATLLAIRKRIELFHEHTKPVLSYYKRKKMLIEINGEQEISEIHAEIMHKIKKVR